MDYIVLDSGSQSLRTNCSDVVSAIAACFIMYICAMNLLFASCLAIYFGEQFQHEVACEFDTNGIDVCLMFTFHVIYC